MALMKLVNCAALAGERVDSDRFNTGAKRSHLVKTGHRVGHAAGDRLSQLIAGIEKNFAHLIALRRAQLLPQSFDRKRQKRIPLLPIRARACRQR